MPLLRLSLAVTLAVLLSLALPAWLNLNSTEIRAAAASTAPSVWLPPPAKKELVDDAPVELAPSAPEALASTEWLVPTAPAPSMAPLAISLAAPTLSASLLPSLGTALLDLTQVDEAPELLRYVAPRTPVVARSRRLPGKVELRLVVEADGTVSAAEVLSAEPEGIFESAALTAAQQWRFKPAQLNGGPVSVYVDVPLSFSVN
ncbi:TonB family protein [Ferrimonas pelagia]|uniref:Protein TonB n=1 Tax=Ferrimonas pelagia TaxID=1177826 RepID=A0ABP9EG75_9GAMM